MKYFRVKYGFGKDDFYSITEDELPKALRAQVNGTVVAFHEGTVAGNNIITIQPDYQREMGWNRDYDLQGGDYAYIGNKKVEEYRMCLEQAKTQALGTGGAAVPRIAVTGAAQLASEKRVTE